MVLTPWKYPHWFQSGVDLVVASRRKVVLTDASNTVWGALFEGRLTSGSWSSTEKRLNIDCLEMLGVFLALRTFLPDLKEPHPQDASTPLNGLFSTAGAQLRVNTRHPNKKCFIIKNVS